MGHIVRIREFLGFLLLFQLDLAQFFCFLKLIIHMKKLLDSDWLKAVQLKCNTSAKSVTVQITRRNSGL